MGSPAVVLLAGMMLVGVKAFGPSDNRTVTSVHKDVSVIYDQAVSRGCVRAHRAAALSPRGWQLTFDPWERTRTRAPCLSSRSSAATAWRRLCSSSHSSR